MRRSEEATARRAKMIEHLDAARGRCPLSGAKRTLRQVSAMSAYDRYCCKKNFRILTRNIDSKNRPAAQH